MMRPDQVHLVRQWIEKAEDALGMAQAIRETVAPQLATAIQQG
jgi:hypothetical protein